MEAQTQHIEVRDRDGLLCLPVVSLEVPDSLAKELAAAKLRTVAGLGAREPVFVEWQRNITGTGYRVAGHAGRGEPVGHFATVSPNASFLWQCESFECSRCGGTDEDNSIHACGNCDNCTECCTCDMWYCESCDEYVSDDVPSCGNCENCESCCDCDYCSACSENRYQDDMCGDGCGNCDNCCDCTRCDNCRDAVDSTCEDGYGEECCCDSDCSHAQDDEDED